MGYTIVGIEQTSSSVQLQNHAPFPKKTLILLGDERRGIPVHLLSLVDMCIEIPQVGITRSLNVHVCGAIVMWEYLRGVLL
jgi:tRNA G18 (ribose-2'-O)-methylase SpoU